ncbi:DUF2180 family protein [Actinomycetota bacterium Odt1-20B]
MNCYDCALADEAVAAVAVCHRCGVGLCAEHVRVGREPVPRTAGMGLSHSTRLARHVTCPVCHGAEVPEYLGSAG